MKTSRKSALLVLLLLATVSCSRDRNAEFTIDYEKYTLDNGLQVVLHVDRSDPIAAVAVTYHVGSAREVRGRTGFAHLFEHLLFQNSENLGEGGLDELIQSVGGTMNGSTSRDMTVYYEVVPNDALEKILWAESDRLGFFINTVQEHNFEREIQIVKNEKRQRVDNTPYGHTDFIIDSHLYPPGHPYSWQVIGSLDDLENVNLQDVKDFYEKWYAPNNCTLVIAGDFDTAEVKKWIEKYFGEIPPRGTVEPLDEAPVALNESKMFYYEDKFAELPELTIAWPTVKQYTPDYYALNILSQLLARGKKSPLYKILVEEDRLTPDVSLYNRSSELGGRLTLTVRAFPGTDLDDVEKAIEKAFQKFESDGIQERDLERIKAGLETDFYDGISSVLGKAFQLGYYNIFAGDPGFVSQDIRSLMSVGRDDVLRVYKRYVKAKPHITTSFIPSGMRDLMVDGSVKADVVEEKIVMGSEKDFGPKQDKPFRKTPTQIDRSNPPPLGMPPEVHIPPVWTADLSNGMTVYGIEHDELPLVRFSIQIGGGHLLDDSRKNGVANLMTDIMMEGTRSKTPEELEEAIDLLGSTINMYTSNQAITITGTSLARNFESTLALVEEMLLEPRWDEKQFSLIKQKTNKLIQERDAEPFATASDVFGKIIYGKDHILAYNVLGTHESLESITIDDLQDFYERFYSPAAARMHIVGKISKERVLQSLSGLSGRWKGKEFEIPDYVLPEPPRTATLYFVDRPDAKQSVIIAGYLALSRQDSDYYPASVMNYKLGGGFSSRLNHTLREVKGYTYGAASGFSGSNIPGPFYVNTSVRSNVTFESVKIIKQILENYRSDFSQQDLEDTKNYLVRRNARSFETLDALLGMLQNISTYGLPYDYVKQREKIVTSMTVDRIRELAEKYIKPDRMTYVVVGDARTQLKKLERVGLGKPVLVDKNADPIR